MLIWLIYYCNIFNEVSDIYQEEIRKKIKEALKKGRTLYHKPLSSRKNKRKSKNVDKYIKNADKYIQSMT